MTRARLAGARENRWMHLLSGPPADVPAEVDATAAPADDATLQAAVAALKQSVAELRDEIASLRPTVEGLRAASGRNGG